MKSSNSCRATKDCLVYFKKNQKKCLFECYVCGVKRHLVCSEIPLNYQWKGQQQKCMACFEDEDVNDEKVCNTFLKNEEDCWNLFKALTDLVKTRVNPGKKFLLEMDLYCLFAFNTKGLISSQAANFFKQLLKRYFMHYYFLNQEILSQPAADLTDLLLTSKAWTSKYLVSATMISITKSTVVLSEKEHIVQNHILNMQRLQEEPDHDFSTACSGKASVQRKQGSVLSLIFQNQKSKMKQRAKRKRKADSLLSIPPSMKSVKKKLNKWQRNLLIKTKKPITILIDDDVVFVSKSTSPKKVVIIGEDSVKEEDLDQSFEKDESDIRKVRVDYVSRKSSTTPVNLLDQPVSTPYNIKKYLELRKK